jgi:hypothetical protein
MASHSKGGITELLEMEIDEFLLWIKALEELNKN